MQKYQQQQLIFLALFIIGVYGELQINYFHAFDPKAIDDRSSIAANKIKLWANVTDCLEPSCKCTVTIDGYNDQLNTFQFKSEKETLHSLEILKLTPNTDYTFILSCGGAPVKTKRLNVTTDYDRPVKVVKNLTVTATSTKVRIDWLPPSISSDAYSYYIINIDNKSYQIAKNNPFFEISDSFTPDLDYTFNLIVCYTNNQNDTLCSNSNDAKGSFRIPSPTVTTSIIPTTTTTPSSFSISSYSNSIILFIFSLIFLHQIN